MTRPITQRLAQFAAAGAVVAFAASLAAHHPDGATAAESGFLALLLGLTLGSLSLSVRARPAVVSASLLLAVALCLPAGEGTRAALVGVLLVATVGWTTWRTFGSPQRLSWWDAAAVTLAWQAILRSDRLLAVEWTLRTGVWLVALPLAAATAVWWHSRRADSRASLILLAPLFGLGPGLGVVPLAALALAVALAPERAVGTAARVAASLAAVVAIAWNPAAAPAMLVLAATLAFTGRRYLAWLPALGALLWAVTQLAAGVRGGGGLAWVVVALPFAALAPARVRPLAAAAFALALAHPSGAAPALLAPALVLAATAATQQRQAHVPQALWSLLMLSGVAVAAGLPWLRQPLALAAPPTLGLPPWVAGVLVVLLAVLVLAVRRSRWRPAGWALPAGAATAIALLSVVPQPQRIVAQPVVLAPESTSWSTPIALGDARRLIVDSFVTGSGELAAGSVLVTMELAGGEGPPRVLELTHDRETADWAARRLGRPNPAPSWLVWHSGDGGLAARYRARWTLDPSRGYRSIRLLRADDLPPEVEIAVLAVSAQ